MNARSSSVRSEIFVVYRPSKSKAPAGRHVDAAPDGACSFRISFYKDADPTGLLPGTVFVRACELT